MKMLFDYFPIIIFFAVFQIYTGDASNTEATKEAMIMATKAGIAASGLQVILYWLKTRQFEKMHLISLGLIAVFGSITIALGDPLYIKWKTTILEWVFALVFIGSQYIGKKNLVERMMGHVMKAPDNVWKKLNFAWAGFFTAIGFINLYVIYNFSDEFWVNFKLFGMLGMTVVFVIAQGIFMAKYVIQEDSDKDISKEETK